MKKPVKSIRHKEAKRAHIPSGEEAGYEAGSPIVHRGQDPELFWMNKYGEDDGVAPLTIDLIERSSDGNVGDFRKRGLL